MKMRHLVKGAMTFVPGMEKILPKANEPSPPSPYFYGNWLKHVALLSENGVYGAPKAVAELGPGVSLGLGLAALLTGANRYYGLDMVAHTSRSENLKVLNELVTLFKERAPRPTKGWPDFDHLLDERLFPSRIFTEECLQKSLQPERIEHIRQALNSASGQSGDITLSYQVPWNDSNVIEENSMDLIVSHTVLQHVVDLQGTYQSLYKWLKPGGIMSHQIDLRSHGLADEWNGHRAIPEPVWKIMMGKRAYLINREPWSAHRRLMIDCGFELICALKINQIDGIPRSRHAKRWRDLSDEDIDCAGVYFQARKLT